VFQEPGSDAVPPHWQVVSLVAMLKDVSLSGDEMEIVVDKIADSFKKMPASEMPPLVHQVFQKLDRFLLQIKCWLPLKRPRFNCFWNASLEPLHFKSPASCLTPCEAFWHLPIYFKYTH
jgi:hypothetical protein